MDASYSFQCYDNLWCVTHCLLSNIRKPSGIRLFGRIHDSVILAINYLYGIESISIDSKRSKIINEYGIMDNYSYIIDSKISFDTSIAILDFGDKVPSNIGSAYIISEYSIDYKPFSTCIDIAESNRLYYIYGIEPAKYIRIVKDELLHSLSKPIVFSRLNCRVPSNVTIVDSRVRSIDNVYGEVYNNPMDPILRVRMELPMSNRFIGCGILRCIISKKYNVDVFSTYNYSSIRNGSIQTIAIGNMYEAYKVVARSTIKDPFVTAEILGRTGLDHGINMLKYTLYTRISLALEKCTLVMDVMYATGVNNHMDIYIVSNDVSYKPSELYESVMRAIMDSYNMDYMISYGCQRYINSAINKYYNLVRDNKPFPRSFQYKDIKAMILSSYMYTTKSTGLRVNVYLTHDGIFVKDLNGCYRMISNSKYDEISILDAEDVNGIIYVFDILVYKDIITIDKPFIERYKLMHLIKDKVLVIKEFKELTSISKLKLDCVNTEGCVVYAKDSIYNEPPLKAKWVNTVDVYIDKELGKIYGTDDNNLAAKDFSQLPKEIVDYIATHDITKGLVYEVMCISSYKTCCTIDTEVKLKEVPTKNPNIKELVFDINGFPHRAFGLRTDKIMPNKITTINEIFSNEGFNFINGCGLDYTRAASSVLKKLGMIIMKAYGGKYLLDVGTGRGGDVLKFPIFNGIEIVEPYKPDFDEAVRRLNESRIQYIPHNCPLMSLTQISPNIDCMSVCFCMNLFTDADITTLMDIMRCENIKSFLFIYMDSMPRNYNGRHISINRKGDCFEVDRRRYDHDPLHTVERVVKIADYATKELHLVPIIDTYPFSDTPIDYKEKIEPYYVIPMTNDERALLREFRYTLYVRPSINISPDEAYFIPMNATRQFITKDFMNISMGISNGVANIGISEVRYAMPFVKDANMVKAFRYFRR